ncbi:MAG: transcriptional repressor LexA [Patescibacteria group bacterium]
MLTPKQKAILEYIVNASLQTGYAPSLPEIAKEFGLKSVATVHEHLTTLEAKGYIRRNPNQPRGIELTRQSARTGRTILLPLSGFITAGQPIEALETHETFAVPAQFVVDSFNSYVLRVRGESMIEEGIFDGDYVVVERNPSPSNGDVVVALLDNAYATLKKFYREKTRIRLQPANRTMKPIYARHVNIQGIVRAVIRRFGTA